MLLLTFCTGPAAFAVAHLTAFLRAKLGYCCSRRLFAANMLSYSHVLMCIKCRDLADLWAACAELVKTAS